MVRTLTCLARLALALALLLAGPGARAQPSTLPGPGPFVPYGTPGSRQATAQDIIKALQGVVQSVNGALTNPTLYGGTLRSPVFRTADGSAMEAYISGTPDASYARQAIVLPYGGLHVRGAATGCQDQAVGFSLIAGNAATPTGAGIGLHSGFNGGCQGGLSSLAAYGVMDGGGAFEQMYQQAAPLTMLAPTVTTTSIKPPTGQTFTADQLAMLAPWVYVLSNAVDGSGHLYGSYVASASLNADGSIPIIGWVPLGSGNAAAGQVPSTSYLAGTGTQLTVWVGMPNNLFTRNEVCSREASMPLVLAASICSEVDVVNNGATDMDSSLNGYGFVGQGAKSPGTALSFGSTAGQSNAFWRDIALNNFRAYGLVITQDATGGGVGILIATQTSGAVPLNVLSSRGGNGFTVWNDGHIDVDGDVFAHRAARNASAAATPVVGSSTALQAVIGTVAANTAFPLASPLQLTWDGNQVIAGGSNVFYLPGGTAASDRLEAHLAAYATDNSGNPQMMSATLKWSLKSGPAGPATSIMAEGSAVETIEAQDSYFSGCHFTAAISYAQQSVWPQFFCPSALPNLVLVGGDERLTYVYAH